MVNNPSKLWLVDGRTGEAVTYEELFGQLTENSTGIPSLFQPTSTRAALEGIAAALLSDIDVTLFDVDFGRPEIEALGYSPTQLNQPASDSAPQLPNPAILAQRASGQSRARLGLFTSGSTGLPKLVWQTVANLARAVKVSPRHETSVWALAYNPTHVAAIQVYLQALANGCTVVDIYGMDRPGVLTALERHGVTHLSATPSFYRLLLPVERPLPGVRSVTLGGESADTRLLARLAELFPNARMHNVYASTEAGTLLVADGDVFAIAPGLEGKVTVREGRLIVHRDLLGKFSGGTIDDDWYDTGDVVEVVAEQPLRFRIVARERDWVNVGGSKVNPRNVEAVLEEHPAVTHARVFARKNSIMGSILCAEVVARAPLPTEADLRAFLAERLQPFKVPRMIRCVASLATTRTGKLSRL